MATDKANFAPFVETLNVPTFSFRWMTAACYQFKLPGGKTFVVDPFLPAIDHPNPMWRQKSGDLLPEDLGSADYVFVNHTHADHVGTLKEVFDLYKPRILCHESQAYLLCKNLNMPQQKIFPMANEQTYHFKEFAISTFIARHVGGDRGTDFAMGPAKDEAKFTELNAYGSLFNTNFILTTDTNRRIAFCAGTFDDNERYLWKDAGIDVFIRQMSWHIRQNMMEDIAEDFMVTGAPIMLPVHHEEDYHNEDKNDWARRFNEYLASKGYYGRLYMPEKAVWHDITLGATLSK